MKSPWWLLWCLCSMVGQPTMSTLQNDILSDVCAGELERGISLVAHYHRRQPNPSRRLGLKSGQRSGPLDSCYHY